jgi:hypothetical protein
MAQDGGQHVLIALEHLEDAWRRCGGGWGVGRRVEVWRGVGGGGWEEGEEQGLRWMERWGRRRVELVAVYQAMHAYWVVKKEHA